MADSAQSQLWVTIPSSRLDDNWTTTPGTSTSTSINTNGMPLQTPIQHSLSGVAKQLQNCRHPLQQISRMAIGSWETMMQHHGECMINNIIVNDTNHSVLAVWMHSILIYSMMTFTVLD